MEHDMKMPYVKPSLETIDVKTLTETVGPVQALSSGSNAIDPAMAPQQLGSSSSKPFKRR